MIYLVEDEPAIREAVSAYLGRHGFRVQPFDQARDAEAALLEHPPELLLIDVHLLDGDEAGFELVEHVRAAGLTLPILMLTSRDAVGDRILGLNVGADDYLPKPFDLGELLARIHALLRREWRVKTNRLERGPLHLDFAERSVLWKGQPVTLTPREYALLELLARSPERIFSTEALIDNVWGEGVSSSNVVRVYIHYLRTKLAPEIVAKVSGGYRLGV
jgi:two-component system response regulator QseB